MSFVVEYSQNALDEIADSYFWILERSPQSAAEWRMRLLSTVATLTKTADTHRHIPENIAKGHDIRQLLFGKRRGQCRVIYVIEGRKARILSFRHSFRQPLKEGDLPL